MVRSSHRRRCMAVMAGIVLSQASGARAAEPDIDARPASVAARAGQPVPSVIATLSSGSGSSTHQGQVIILAGDETPAQIIRRPRSEVITVELAEVQHGTADGLEYFTIEIVGQEVGPRDCSGNVLRMDIDDDAGGTRSRTLGASLEQVALEAMLGAESVMITVSMEPDACIDGRPTFTHLDLLPSHP